MRFVRWLCALGLCGAAAACERGAKPPATSGPPPALGAHALVTHDQNQGTSPAVTPPVTTQPTGSLLLAVSMGRTVNFVVPADSHGNTWEPIGKRHAYADGPFYTAMWAAERARGGSGHTLSARKPSDPADEISLAFLEIVNGTRVRDAAYAYPRRGRPHTAGKVTTTGPALLIAVWGGDAWELHHTATPGDGFQLIESYLALGPTSGVQIAIAAKQVTAPGTYSMTWTATPDQGAACYLIAVQ
jgi:hypothetical protein